MKVFSFIEQIRRFSILARLNISIKADMNAQYGGNPVQPMQPGMMQPVVFDPNVNLFEQHMAARKRFMQDKEALFLKQLAEKFPAKYVKVHGIVLLVLAVLMFLLQILRLATGYPNAANSSGIW